MEKEFHLLLSKDNEILDELYRKLLGSVMYIMTTVRFEICFAVSYLGSNTIFKRLFIYEVTISERTSGYVIQGYGCSISWPIKKQATVMMLCSEQTD